MSLPSTPSVLQLFPSIIDYLILSQFKKSFVLLNVEVAETFVIFALDLQLIATKVTKMLMIKSFMMNYVSLFYYM